MRLARSSGLMSDAQSYVEHVEGVLERALRCADLMRLPLFLRRALVMTIVYHDMAKLLELNQRFLAGETDSPAKMLNHVDAGVAHLLSIGTDCSFIGAIIGHGHHIGLMAYRKGESDKELHLDMGDPKLELGKRLRDGRSLDKVYREFSEYPGQTVKDHIDNHLLELLAAHGEEVCVDLGDEPPLEMMLDALDMRFLMSCMVEGDWGDAATASGDKVVELEERDPRWKQRLEKLLEWIGETRKAKGGGERQKGRDFLLEDFLNMDARHGAYCCTGYVGMGKTASGTAGAMKMAIANGRRRIFWIAPYESIIDQHVDFLREAVTLEGEKKEMVVAEQHHCARYISSDSDYYDSFVKHVNTLWEAPVVVTTAVQFFETLGCNVVGRLRKLSRLANSVIMIDESHMSLPSHLQPIGLYWLKQLVKKWNCQVVFLSGSTVRMWDIESVRKNSKWEIPVVDVCSDRTKAAMASLEERRVSFKRVRKSFTVGKFCKWINTRYAGVSRLVVCNTIPNAVHVTKCLKEITNDKIYHLSTALTPSDRQNILKNIKEDLKQNKPIILVGTSCIECGVDFNFQVVFRESFNLLSLLQAAGRGNREMSFYNTEVWDFKLRPCEEYDVTFNSFADVGRSVLSELFEEGHVGPEYCTEAVEREYKRKKSEDPKSEDPKSAVELMRQEKIWNFQAVNDNFNVILKETYGVIIDKDIIARMVAGEEVREDELQRASVNMSESRFEEFAGSVKTYSKDGINEARTEADCWKKLYSDVHVWEGDYDPDMYGYMM